MGKAVRSQDSLGELVIVDRGVEVVRRARVVVVVAVVGVLDFV